MLEIVEYWKKFIPKDGNNIHPKDEAFFTKQKQPFLNISHNTTKMDEKANALLLGLLPQPYMGDLENARIVIVMLNPGYEGSEFNEHNDPIARKAIINTIEQKFAGPLADYRYMYLNPQFNDTAGYKYLCNEKSKGQVKGTLRDCLLKYSEDSQIDILEAQKVFSKNICMVETLPYHSKKFGQNKRIYELPSFQIAKRFIEEKVKDERNLIFFARQEAAFRDDCFNRENVARFIGSQALGAFFTLEEHGKRLLDHLAKYGTTK